MAGEKARVTQEIIDSIVMSSKDKVEQLKVAMEQDFFKKTKEYEEIKKNDVNQKLDSLHKNYNEMYERKSKDIDWEIKMQVLRELEVLWSKYAYKVKQEVIEYTKSNEYSEWIKDVQQQYPNAKYLIRKEDETLFKPNSYEIIEINLGGLYVEDHNTVYDLTLDSKYERVIDEYKQTTRIEEGVS